MIHNFVWNMSEWVWKSPDAVIGRGQQQDQDEDQDEDS